MRPLSVVLGISLAFVLGCKDKKSDGPPAEPPPSANKAADVPTTPAAAAAKKTLDGPSVADPNNPDWVPQEHTSGIKRFKDPGVYVDGKPVAIIKFGELPIGLPVAWHEEETPVEFKGGEKPKPQMVRQRRYRVLDYFKALGIDIKRIKAVHLNGGTRRNIGVAIKGDDFRKATKFTFRFGSDVYGKAIPQCPTSMKAGGCPDNLIGLYVYIDKAPPALKDDGLYYVDDKPVDGVPYYGDPLRGGIRVYQDGPLAAWIKRGKLAEVEDAPGIRSTGADGVIRWNFFKVLENQGVDTSTIKEAWLVHANRHVKQIDREDLLKVTFQASDKKGGEILFGNDRLKTNAIHLHKKKISRSLLPKLTEYEKDE